MDLIDMISYDNAILTILGSQILNLSAKTPENEPNLSKSVMIIESEALLGAGLSSLLSTQEGLNVVNLPINEQAHLAAKIEELHPDVIIVDENILIARMDEILLAAWHVPDLRMISVTLNDNHMQVYEKRLVQVQRSSDLFALIY